MAASIIKTKKVIKIMLKVSESETLSFLGAKKYHRKSVYTLDYELVLNRFMEL